MLSRLSRRTFLKRSSLALTAPLILPRLSLGQSPNGKLQLAAIGVAGQGDSDLAAIFSSGKVDVVALCDVDETRLNEAAAKYTQARKYFDWRELLASEAGNIDAVCVGTPDHMHAPIAYSAISLGKHCYCEKPLTQEVYEARQLRLAAERADVVTQMGNQIHAHACYRNAAKMMQDGVIGKVKEWHSWISNGYGGTELSRPAAEDALPQGLNWDLWLGVAPQRPYKAEIYHPRLWRYWQDFGSGALGDFGCHIFDPVFSGLGIGAPLRITAETPEFNNEVWPFWEVIHYEFPATAMTAGDTVRGTWYDGGKRPGPEAMGLPAGTPLPDAGSVIVGEEGVMVLPHCDKATVLYPAEKFKEFKQPELPGLNHYHQWVNACLGTDTAASNFSYAGPLAEAVLLGNVANRCAGQTLEWDAPNLRITNMPEANALLRVPYREGWEVEGLS